MLKKIVAGVFAALAIFSLTAATPTGYFIPLDQIERVSCDQGIGTGSRIDDDLVLTAEHVASAGHCMIDGQPTETVYSNFDQDLAVLRTASRSSARIPLACESPREGGRYYAIGYAFGSDLVVQQETGTRTHLPSGRWRGADLYRGQAFHGMSGGPVLDERGYIVGVVNAIPDNGRALTVSRSLTGTYLCPAPAHA